MFCLPNASPAPFLLMLQGAVELIPVALCHLLTRKRILEQEIHRLLKKKAVNSYICCWHDVSRNKVLDSARKHKPSNTGLKLPT